MAVKRTGSKQSQRKPFWERLLEWMLSMLKRLVVPALLIWLVGWLWLGGVFAKGADMVWNSFVEWSGAQGFVVKDVVIEGRNRVSIENLSKAINVKIGDPLLSFDVHKAQDKIETFSWVKSVTVGRHYNGVVNVNLTERVPFVVWDRDGRHPVIVDIDGHIIEGANPKNFFKLLVVHGVSAPEHAADLMQMVVAEPDVVKYIKGAEWIGDRRWDLITTMGTRIHMPEDDLGFALSRLAKIEQEKKILSKPLLSIDLRGKDRIIIESESGQSKDVMSLSSNTKTNLI